MMGSLVKNVLVGVIKQHEQVLEKKMIIYDLYGDEKMLSNKIWGGHALRKALGITILAFLLVSITGAAATLTVCQNGCTYSSIQPAINASSTGDTIQVLSGTYYENVNVSKRLILSGVNTGGGKPVVDAGGNGSAITLAADGIMLEGFNATGAGYDGSSSEAAGIRVTTNSNTLIGNNASNNDYGIFLLGNNNTLIGNKASNNNWDGIHLSSSSNNTLIDNNASNNDYGIHLSSSSNNTLISNKASNNGYSGIFLFSSNKSVLKNNLMNGNNTFATKV
jgi:parallel beta-helix repeat protein